jgi:hypothetical protein
VLWDSRTIHCNHPAFVEPSSDNVADDRLIRLVGYVCMTPFECATPEVIEKRCQAYVYNESTSHCKGIFFVSIFVVFIADC